MKKIISFLIPLLSEQGFLFGQSDLSAGTTLQKYFLGLPDGAALLFWR